jgi:hypothetical protein
VPGYGLRRSGPTGRTLACEACATATTGPEHLADGDNDLAEVSAGREALERGVDISQFKRPIDYRLDAVR